MKNQRPTIVKTLSYLCTLAVLSLAVMSCGSDDPEPTPVPVAPCEGVTITFDLTQTGCDEVTVENAAGGESPYEYSIDGTNFQTDPVFTGVTGTASITTQDANECSASKDITVEALTLEATAEAYTITAAAAGGIAPYEYSIDGGSTFQSETTFDVTDATDYTITVKDATGCTVEANVTASDITTMTDTRDGQTYNVVKIGDQIWLAENFNLNTNTADSTSSWYYNDSTSSTFQEEYGRLYTWYVAKEIAPEGWRLPADTDVDELVTYLGGASVAGSKMKVGSSSGFEGKFGGSRVAPDYYNIGVTGYFWQQSEYNTTDGDLYYISSSSTLFRSGAYKANGLSVRFIKK